LESFSFRGLYIVSVSKINRAIVLEATQQTCKSSEVFELLLHQAIAPRSMVLEATIQTSKSTQEEKMNQIIPE
jgi:hypothetical protein